MDLESPLRTIASPVEAETLRVLAGADTDFSAPQIHRLIASASGFGVRKALARLAESGVVLQRARGGHSTWQGNRDHVLWPAIESAVGARREVIERLRAEVEPHNELAVYLYGSFARRLATRESDIDILVVHPDDARREAMVDLANHLSDRVSIWTGNEGQVYSATRTEVRDAVDRGDAVMLSIRQDAEVLRGPEFEQLLRILESEKVVHG